MDIGVNIFTSSKYVHTKSTYHNPCNVLELKKKFPIFAFKEFKIFTFLIFVSTYPAYIFTHFQIINQIRQQTNKTQYLFINNKI